MNPNDANDFQEFLNHLTDHALQSLKAADGISRTLGSPYVGTEHILLGVLATENSMGAKIMAENGVSLDRARNVLNITPKTLVSNLAGKGLSETAKLTLKMSADIAMEYGQDMVGTEHMLFAILTQRNARATVMLRDMSVDIDKLTSELEQFLNRQGYDENESVAAGSRRRTKRPGKSILDVYGTDLTLQAKNNKLDPVIGREDQIKRLITILNRRTKNNPVLIGEPGVGKTAVVEGLAQRIVSEDVPDGMLDTKIYIIDLAGMIAGTKYRGEFEDRLKKVMQELEESKNIIAFIDELHLIVGAGAAEGAMDAGNILKPALARGKIQVIGATTTSEYTKYIEKDAALERRFQPIQVPETTVPETIAILKGLKKRYESFHGVTISDDVIVDTVNLAKRYINDRYMPDKAIDLLDEAAAHIKVGRAKTSPDVRKLQKELKHATIKMEEAVDGEDYEKAAKFKQKVSKLTEELETKKAAEASKHVMTLTSGDMAETISRMTGVPVGKVVKSEASYLLNLEKNLEKHVIGQTEAVQAVSRAVRRSRSGIGSAKRPIGSFVFMGPTGVGKTELARVLAREFFGSEDALVKIDMSEFGEHHTVSRLVGAPAGYVGYDDGGQLTDKIRRQPYSVVLFDEIEKAHPEVFNMLLQIMEDGRLSDAKGRAIDFTNTIIIMTSNVGAEKLQKEATLGFSVSSREDAATLDGLHERNKTKVHDELKRFMRPELLNRIDKIIVFRALTKDNVKYIIDNLLDDLRSRISKQGLGISLTATGRNWLLEYGYDAHNGARPMRRLIQDEIEDRLAEGLLDGSYKKGDVIRVSAKNNKLVYSIDKE